MASSPMLKISDILVLLKLMIFLEKVLWEKLSWFPVEYSLKTKRKLFVFYLSLSLSPITEKASNILVSYSSFSTKVSKYPSSLLLDTLF